MTLTHVSNHHSSMSNHHGVKDYGVKDHGMKDHGVKGGIGASVGFIHTENVHSSNNSFPHQQNNSSLHSNNLVNSSSNNHNNSKTHSSSMAPAHLHPSHRVSSSSSRNSSIHETTSNNSSSAVHHRVNHSSSLAHHNNHHLPGSNHLLPGSNHHNSSSAHPRDVGMASDADLECPLGHEEWDDYPSDALLDTGEPGIPVRALYDYEGAEADELSFKQGKESFFLFLSLVITMRKIFILIRFFFSFLLTFSNCLHQIPSFSILSFHPFLSLLHCLHLSCSSTYFKLNPHRLS